MENIETVYAIIISLIICVFLICDTIRRKKLYESGSYYQITKKPFFLIRRNPGIYGEYLIYESLKHFELKKARFLFNLYIPTYKGKTTEIDAVMISQSGIFVFESKNYSGWIFGDENQEKWVQSLYTRYGAQKEYFFNPIMQNQYHIDYLKRLINKNVKMYSVIVFSDRCEFKNIKRKENSKAYLIHRSNLYNTINNIYNKTNDFLTIKGVDDIYNMLYKYSQTSKIIKVKHVTDIDKRF